MDGSQGCVYVCGERCIYVVAYVPGPHVDPNRPDTHLEANDADERVVLSCRLLLRLFHLRSAAASFAVGGRGQRRVALDAAGPARGADDAELLRVLT